MKPTMLKVIYTGPTTVTLKAIRVGDFFVIPSDNGLYQRVSEAWVFEHRDGRLLTLDLALHVVPCEAEVVVRVPHAGAFTVLDPKKVETYDRFSVKGAETGREIAYEPLAEIAYGNSPLDEIIAAGERAEADPGPDDEAGKRRNAIPKEKLAAEPWHEPKVGRSSPAAKKQED